MSAVRVMIVEDSPTAREFLRQAVEADPRLAVVAACGSAEEALAALERSAPDVISMDIHLPRMGGLEATRRIMETRPTPIVIVSRSVNAQELDSTMDALRAGAVSAVEKPSPLGCGGAKDAAARICRELFVMSQIKVVRQRFNGPRAAARKTPASVWRGNGRPPMAPGKPARMLGIVASSGGPHAVETVLASLGAEFPLPIVLVQHMTASFHAGFVSWLDRISPQPVEVACDGDLPEAAHVYVAPENKHLFLRGDRLIVSDGAAVNGQRPSGDVLLRSLAEELGPQAVGVVLTGMGNDGAEGLLAIRRAGGYTIAEDESTAVVNGMPEVARRIGAACVSLPLGSIGAAIKNLMPVRQEVRS